MPPHCGPERTLSRTAADRQHGDIITLRAEWFKGHFREADLQAMYQCRPVIAGIASATIADTGNTVIPYAAPPALPEPAAAALRHVRASRCGRAPGAHSLRISAIHTIPILV